MEISAAPGPAPSPDEDIIELTDIVEKGAVPAPQAQNDGKNELTEHMADLRAKPDEKPEEDDLDLDALLNSTDGIPAEVKDGAPDY